MVRVSNSVWLKTVGHSKISTLRIEEVLFLGTDGIQGCRHRDAIWEGSNAQAVIFTVRVSKNGQSY